MKLSNGKEVTIKNVSGGEWIKLLDDMDGKRTGARLMLQIMLFAQSPDGTAAFETEAAVRKLEIKDLNAIRDGIEDFLSKDASAESAG